MLITRFLKDFIQAGALTLITADGRTHKFVGAEQGPDITLRLHKRSLEWTLGLRPDPGFGNAYVDGSLTIEDGTLRDFMWIANRNFEILKRAQPSGLGRITQALHHYREMRRLFNPPQLARHKVSQHYDLTGELFALFLDDDRQYSCAYFTDPRDSLEDAQARKKRRLAAKLLLQPGHEVLDIGSGWGGLGLYLNAVSGCAVDGVTLSHERLAYAQARAHNAGVNDQVRFDLQDYRLIDKTYDRIVSVGMFEHVGPKHYPEFFEAVSHRLKDDGVAVLHSIGRYNAPEPVSPWIERNIFPGGYIPSLSEVFTQIERANLWVTDVEIMRLHYAETLKHWYDRFQANRAKAAALYDERFCRMWEFYLTGCEMGFRVGNLMVFQIQLAKQRDAVPLTRDYIDEKERQITRRKEQRVA